MLEQSSTTVEQVSPTPEAGQQRLSTIFELAQLLATEHDLDSLLPKFLSSLIRTLEAAEAGNLLLYDSSEDCLEIKGAQGYDFELLRQIRVAPGEAMSGRAYETGLAGLYPDPRAVQEVRSNLTSSNSVLFEAATSGKARPQSAVCVPLATGKGKVGALVLENRSRPGAFVEEDLPFLTAVADLIALFIDNIQLREELRKVEALAEANRMKSELISTLAHEMRTPLTSIKGYSTALLMEEATFGAESQQEFLRIIDEECDVLQDLIHDLLESSIIDAGLLRLEPQPVRLSRLAGEAVTDISRRTDSHRFVVDFPADFPIVEADPYRILQVLRNLLDNAVKYSPDGGLIVIRGGVAGEEVVVSVADQGVGIAPEHLNRLFEKFFRVKWGLGRHVVGSGLGLPISRTIVESHGGRIWAESRLGEGSTFFFALPIKPADGQGTESVEGEAK